MRKKAKRIPDAACKMICTTRGRYTLPQCDMDHDELVLIVGMFTVDEHIIFVEIPFAEFAPEYTHIEDFEPLIFPKLRGWLKNDQETTFGHLHKWDSKPYCRIDPKGKLTLCLNLYSVASEETHKTVAGTSVNFSDFAKDFACLSDFERLVVDYIDKLSVRSEILGASG